MELSEYQRKASRTDQNPKNSQASSRKRPDLHEVIPLLGLVGEVGSLLSEYKKLLRDGEIHRKFRDEVAEELGDVLWYVANVADKFELDLNEVADENLTKIRGRWSVKHGDVQLYDQELPPTQQLPRRFEYLFEEQDQDGTPIVRMQDASSGLHTGDPLSDNTYEDDGYRFHDVMHLAFAAFLGWSPVLRKLLRNAEKIVHRKPEQLDNAEDGGRARVIEEAIVAAAFIYAEDHAMLDGATTVGQGLLHHIQSMTRNLEVCNRSAWEWDRALLTGFEVWRELIRYRKGTVVGA